MTSADGRFVIVYNGEIYNYLELRDEIGRDGFRTGTDTEVILEAYRRWGPACLSRFIGMFAFVILERETGVVFAARDRFGVKPLYYGSSPDGGLLFASEIKALHVAGLPRHPDLRAWATYLRHGLTDHAGRTFWAGVSQVPPGTYASWSDASGFQLHQWYDVATAAHALGPDERDDDIVEEEVDALLLECVRLRLRSDVPVGLCLSGGVDSSLLLSLVEQAGQPGLAAFTFECGSSEYDETPWVRQALEGRTHPLHVARLGSDAVPALAARVLHYQDEPFGGIPTLGMAMVHERARMENVTVLLDGNGMDEGWAGYEYYARAAQVEWSSGPVQGSSFDSSAVRVRCLQADVLQCAEPLELMSPLTDPLARLQHRDLRFTKIPRAMRFADRVSMMHARELREPFLDHRLVELGLRQPARRKVHDGVGKWLVRRIARRRLPAGLAEAPKRAVQTPQREWLRGPLASWVDEHIEGALSGWGKEWLDAGAVRSEWRHYCEHGRDDSFLIWQWLMLGLMQETHAA